MGAADRRAAGRRPTALDDDDVVVAEAQRRLVRVEHRARCELSLPPLGDRVQPRLVEQRLLIEPTHPRGRARLAIVACGESGAGAGGVHAALSASRGGGAQCRRLTEEVVQGVHGAELQALPLMVDHAAFEQLTHCGWSALDHRLLPRPSSRPARAVTDRGLGRRWEGLVSTCTPTNASGARRHALETTQILFLALLVMRAPGCTCRRRNEVEGRVGPWVAWPTAGLAIIEGGGIHGGITDCYRIGPSSCATTTQA